MQNINISVRTSNCFSQNIPTINEYFGFADDDRGLKVLKRLLTRSKKICYVLFLWAHATFKFSINNKNVVSASLIPCFVRFFICFAQDPFVLVCAIILPLSNLILKNISWWRNEEKWEITGLAVPAPTVLTIFCIVRPIARIFDCSDFLNLWCLF